MAGYFFEDLSVGQSSSFRKTITEADIAMFAAVSGDTNPVHIDAEMEELLSKATDQNFVPVVDSRQVFIGIVRRRDLVKYCLRLVQEKRDILPLAAARSFALAAPVAAGAPDLI